MPANKNISREVIILGKLSPAIHALIQILADSGISLRHVNLENEQPKAVLSSISTAVKESSPSLVIAASAAAWRATRVLNAWPASGGLFDTQSLAFRQEPIVIPMPHLWLESIFDHFTANRSESTFSLRTLLDAITGPPTRITDRDLHAAILHYFMAEARHKLPLVSSVHSHGRNDVYAAIRVIQGAALDGWISPEEGMAGCASVWYHAIKQKLVNNSLPLSFYRLFRHLPTKACEETPSFATLLVADDQGFWGLPMRPLWSKLGLTLLHESSPAGVLNCLKNKQNDTSRVRAVLLDMQLAKDTFGGAKLLQTFKIDFPYLPAIVLSVDDQFSETVLLKRMKAFAYLNKHSLAEQGPGRDALSAFRQVRDAILVATFSSLSEDLRQLFDLVLRAYEECLHSEKTPDKITAIIGLKQQAEHALDSFRDGCRGMFQGSWQDSTYSSPLAFRQIIRAFGLVNDKWASLWIAWRFDPDKGNRPWQNGPNVEFPFLIYHQVSTSIRNEASHAMVSDNEFEWLDVWIMILTLFLKIDGTCRGYLAHDQVVRYSELAKRPLEQLTCSIWSLLRVAGSIDTHINCKLDVEQLRSKLCSDANELEMKLKEYHSSQYGFAEGDSKRLSIKPYVIGHVDGFPLMHMLGHKFKLAANFSTEQLQAHLLVIQLISRRVASSR